LIGYERGAGMQRLILTTAIFFLVCAGSVAQESQSGSPPEAPSASAQSQTAPQATNPLQSSMSFLQRKSVFFPNLATNSGPLSVWQKFKLGANNSISLATIGAALARVAKDMPNALELTWPAPLPPICSGHF
jgi:hypothetical protein